MTLEATASFSSLGNKRLVVHAKDIFISVADHTDSYQSHSKLCN